MAPKVSKTTNVRKDTKTLELQKSKTIGHSNAKKDSSEVEEASVFQTFTANESLKDGLCMIRSLGNGKNEIVYLNDLSRDQLSTEQAKRELQDNPKRRNQFELYGWQSLNASKMCRFALRVATKDIFPFQKLPPELRCKIYEIVLLSPYRIQRVALPKYRQERMLPSRYVRRARSRHVRTASPLFIAFSILLTCRQFYDEGMKVFWLNNFRLHDASLFTHRHHISFAKNVQYLTFDWRGLVADGKSFAAFKKFPLIKVLNININFRVYNADRYPRHVNRNKKFQNDQRVDKFCQAHGFDALVELRNLEHITLTLTPTWRIQPLRDQTDQNVKNKEPTRTEIFEEFLRGIVTKQMGNGSVVK